MIPMKRKRISPIQDALYWCRAKRDKDGFVIKFINNFIGSGVFTQKKFLNRDFLLEYGGNLLTYKEGLATEKKYKTDPSVGYFLYFFLTVEEKNTAKDLELHAELRYSYGEGLSLPWRQEVNVVKIEVANSLEVLNNFNTTEKVKKVEFEEDDTDEIEDEEAKSNQA
ncbi:hypothetical protein KUTeg_015100 [Tegillarca granosa]|uniref:Uncharacterized protein n=1 Tax=Tegillarca granosa TaxID=220873 RepID=A0ABQ9ESS1_TEGGR|nr:hypothetical protein KUTeg_015100 [Tegillarca granosa]